MNFASGLTTHEIYVRLFLKFNCGFYVRSVARLGLKQIVNLTFVMATNRIFEYSFLVNFYVYTVGDIKT